MHSLSMNMNSLSVNNMLLLSLLVSFLGSVLTIFLGLVFKKFPAKYGSGTGYNSVTSRKSPLIWDYAQKIAPRYMLQTGIILLIITVVYFIAEVILMNQCHMTITKTNIIVNAIIGGIVEISLFLRIELNLRKKLKEINK